MLSLGRLRSFAGQAQSVVLPLVREGKAYCQIDNCQHCYIMLPPNNIPSAVSLLPSESKEAAKAHSTLPSQGKDHATPAIRSIESALRLVFHERGQQLSHGAQCGSRHHAVPALEAALRGADINKIRDGVPPFVAAYSIQNVGASGCSPGCSALCRRGWSMRLDLVIRAQPALCKHKYTHNVLMLVGDNPAFPRGLFSARQ